MNIIFAGKLCGSCQVRDMDADRADIWYGMAILLDAVKNDFFYQKDGRDVTEEYYIEAMNMVDDLTNFCAECELREPLIKLRIKKWLEKDSPAPESATEKPARHKALGNLIMPKQFQKHQKPE